MVSSSCEKHSILESDKSAYELRWRTGYGINGDDLSIRKEK